MNKPVLWTAASLLAVAAILLLLWVSREGSRDSLPEAIAVGDDRVANQEETPTRGVELFFPGEGGRLYPESRQIPDVGTLEERMAAVAAAVIAGPRGESLRAPLPAELIVTRVYALGERSFALGLEAPGQERLAGSGSRRELLTLYSLVNSVLLNFDQAESLVLIWNGRQPSTFAGHIDTSRPLAANSSLVAGLP